MKYLPLSLLVIIVFAACIEGGVYNLQNDTATTTSATTDTAAVAGEEEAILKDIIDSIRYQTDLPDSIVVSRYRLDTFLVTDNEDPKWFWKEKYELYDSLYVITAKFEDDEDTWKEALLVINMRTLKGVDAMLIRETLDRSSNDFYRELEYRSDDDSLYFLTEKEFVPGSDDYFVVAAGKFVIGEDGRIRSVVAKDVRRPGYRLKEEEHIVPVKPVLIRSTSPKPARKWPAPVPIFKRKR